MIIQLITLSEITLNSFLIKFLFFFIAADNKQIRQDATDGNNALEIGAISNAKEKCIEKVNNVKCVT
jgi:hypothetical protein